MVLYGALILAATTASSQDMTALTLEDLLDVEVIPIDVLGSHIHIKGQWMVGYRFMGSQMGQAAHTAHAEDPGHSMEAGHEVEGYMVTPTAMDMQMHMVELMYGITDRLTAMVMVPYMEMGMDHVTRGGKSFSTASAGLGDLQVMMHYALRQRSSAYIITALGVSLPTGSIDARDATPMGADQRLPYPMQLGSGTVDPIAGLTLVHQREAWSGGVHADAIWRLSKNHNHYRKGHATHAGVWVSWRLLAWLAPTLHVDYHQVGNVYGADPQLNPGMAATADPMLQQHQAFSILPTLNFYVAEGRLKGQRLSLSAELPLFHGSRGFPLEERRVLSLGWQWGL